MYHPRTISINKRNIEVSWSSRMTKTAAKVVLRNGVVMFHLSKILLTSPEDVEKEISAYFDAKKVFLMDCGRLHIRGRKLGSGGFANIFECADDPTTVLKVGRGKECKQLEQETDVYSALSLAFAKNPNQQRYTPELKSQAFGCIAIGRYETDLSRVKGSLSVSIKHAIIADVIRALKFIHECGFVHCDIKSGNILLDTEMRAVLGDLGLSRRYSLYKKRVLNSSNRFGTIPFMSRDVHNRVLPTRRSDMESLGWVIIDLLGRLPWKGEDICEKVGSMKNSWDLNDDNLPEVNAYMRIVLSMQYNDTPKYDEMIKIFTSSSTDEDSSGDYPNNSIGE